MSVNSDWDKTSGQHFLSQIKQSEFMIKQHSEFSEPMNIFSDIKPTCHSDHMTEIHVFVQELI